MAIAFCPWRKQSQAIASAITGLLESRLDLSRLLRSLTLSAERAETTARAPQSAHTK